MTGVIVKFVGGPRAGESEERQHPLPETIFTFGAGLYRLQPITMTDYQPTYKWEKVG